MTRKANRLHVDPFQGRKMKKKNNRKQYDHQSIHLKDEAGEFRYDELGNPIIKEIVHRTDKQRLANNNSRVH